MFVVALVELISISILWVSAVANVHTSGFCLARTVVCLDRAEVTVHKEWKTNRRAPLYKTQLVYGMRMFAYKFMIDLGYTEVV